MFSDNVSVSSLWVEMSSWMLQPPDNKTTTLSWNIRNYLPSDAAPKLHCSKNIQFHSSNTFHKNNTIKIRQLIKNNLFPVQYTGRKRRGGLQGCKCMCVLKPQQWKLILQCHSLCTVKTIHLHMTLALVHYMDVNSFQSIINLKPFHSGE